MWKVTDAGSSGVRSWLVHRVMEVITSVFTRYSMSGASRPPSGASGCSVNRTMPAPRLLMMSALACLSVVFPVHAGRPMSPYYRNRARGRFLWVSEGMVPFSAPPDSWSYRAASVAVMQ